MIASKIAFALLVGLSSLTAARAETTDERIAKLEHILAIQAAEIKDLKELVNKVNGQHDQRLFLQGESIARLNDRIGTEASTLNTRFTSRITELETKIANDDRDLNTKITNGLNMKQNFNEALSAISSQFKVVNGRLDAQGRGSILNLVEVSASTVTQLPK